MLRCPIVLLAIIWSRFVRDTVLFVEFLERLFKVLESHNYVFGMVRKRVDFLLFLIL